MNDAPMARTTPAAVAVARQLGPILAERARTAADEDAFVADNFRLLKESGLVEAGVPAELGGGGASLRELAEMLRILAYHCGSTGLAFSMHTHLVAVPAWRWQNQPAVQAAVEPLLRRLVNERILLVSSGGSDWLPGSGKAERVDGGYRITARKMFTSGAPTGDILMGSAVLEEPGQPASVLHFGIPMNSPHVTILDTWHSLGMRGSGSHDVQIDGHVLPASAIALQRKAGEWHPLFHIIATMAFPLVYAAYLGVAESARDIAVEMAKARSSDPHTVEAVGRMENEITAARLAHGHMLATATSAAPSAATVNDVMIGRQLVERHAIAAVERAMEVAGGAAFYRAAGLERRFRDIQGARYHALRAGPQQRYAGSMALGLPVDKVF